MPQGSTWTFEKVPGFNRMFISAQYNGLIQGSIEMRTHNEYLTFLETIAEWATQQLKLESERLTQSNAPPTQEPKLS
jgi:hypothetical protein